MKPPHVAESAFSVEAKLVSHHLWHSPVSGKNTGVTIFAEGVNFHVCEDIWVEGQEGSVIDIEKLKPISRLGGVIFGKTVKGLETPRPHFAKESDKIDVESVLEQSKWPSE